MSFKSVVGYGIVFLLVALLFFYWIFPLETINFGSVSSKNSNFSLNPYETQGMQFYENMRFPENEISYKIEGCSIAKKDEMERAFQTIDNLTIVNFHEVESNEQISVTCDSEVKYDGDLFIAGEGGPINITKAGEFNVIQQGAITLLKESRCENPNVGIHELLHALGFDHSENPNNIMYPVSKCSQTISEDIVDTINWLYSFESLPDLTFEEVSAKMDARYLDVNLTIRNQGFQASEGGVIEIYADGDFIKEVEFEPLGIGHGRKILMNNILILQTDVNELRFFINTDFEELEKINNEAVLNYEN